MATDFDAECRDGSKITVNVPSSGRIPGGASVERAVPSGFNQGNTLTLNLNRSDFTTAKRIVDKINSLLGPGVAQAIDGGSVRVSAPLDPSQRVDYLSILENLEVDPGQAVAKVIINSRTGTIVIGQNVKPWIPVGPAARPLQRLQSEMQMLLYNHPVNDARDARRQITVNSFWLHGAGTWAAAEAEPSQRLEIPEALRHSALRGDVQAWRQAWQTLDATAVADMLKHLKATGQGTLSLCSEHTAHTYTPAPAAWHQRIARVFNKTSPAAALTALITP